MASIAEQIIEQVTQLPDITQHPHRFGGVEFKLYGREVGHLHGNRMADLPFPVRIRKQLIAEEKASLHHLLPDTGWVSYYIQSEADIPRVVELFRLNHQIITDRRLKRGQL